MEKRFIIESQKYRGETTVISLRIQKDMLDELDELAEKTGRKRNEIITMALQFALDNLEIK